MASLRRGNGFWAWDQFITFKVKLTPFWAES